MMETVLVITGFIFIILASAVISLVSFLCFRLMYAGLIPAAIYSC